MYFYTNKMVQFRTYMCLFKKLISLPEEKKIYGEKQSIGNIFSTIQAEIETNRLPRKVSTTTIMIFQISQSQKPLNKLVMCT